MPGIPLYSLNIKSILDPTTLSLTGYWRGSYSASPWSGTASAGSSSGRNLSNATVAPTAGTALNGFTPASFNGSTNQLSAGATTLDSFISLSAYTVSFLINPTAAVAPGSPISDSPGLLSGGASSVWAITYSTSGVSLSHYNGTTTVVSTVALGTGSYAAVDCRYDGSNVSVRVNGGSWTNNASANLSNLINGQTMKMGTQPASTKFYNGLIMECMISNTALSDTTLNGVKSYYNSRYGLSL